MAVRSYMNINSPKRQELPVQDAGRQRILALARRHFFAYGFRAVTMDDLAKELGMSKKTLYTHFRSKLELVQAILFDKSRDLEADLQRITSEGSSDFLAALHQLLACIQGHLEEIQPPFVRDMRREGPEMFRRIESRRADLLHRYLGKFFADGRKAGVFRKDISAKLITEMLLSATQAIMNPEKVIELGLTPKTCFSAIITVILEGVVTETGRSRL